MNMNYKIHLSLKNIDINIEDDYLEIKLNEVKNIKNMSSMFCLCKYFKIRYIKGKKHKMFDVCSSLKYLSDISNWNTYKVEIMSGIFHNCSSYHHPDISKWNASNVRSKNYMFSGCKLLASLPDISRWNISNVTNKDNMFYSCNFPIPYKFG